MWKVSFTLALSWSICSAQWEGGLLAFEYFHEKSTEEIHDLCVLSSDFDFVYYPPCNDVRECCCRFIVCDFNYLHFFYFWSVSSIRTPSLYISASRHLYLSRIECEYKRSRIYINRCGGICMLTHQFSVVCVYFLSSHSLARNI